jgi:hypothetical protein
MRDDTKHEKIFASALIWMKSEFLAESYHSDQMTVHILARQNKYCVKKDAIF